MYNYDDVMKESIKYFDGDSLAAKVFADKYALRDKNDNYLECSPNMMHSRIAKEFARIQKNKYKNPLSESEIFDLLKDFKYIIPQGSQMFGIGNDFQTISLSNCYVVESPVDSYGGILKSDQQIVQISKRRGGTGIDLSNLRPNKTITNNAAKTSTGIISWMERYSNSIREVGQAGRRGALMITLDVRHPDIEEFMSVKNDPTKVTGANISIKLNDEFLKAVENNQEYQLQWPIQSLNPIISKKVNAKELWNKIIHCAWLRAEPGLLFWDRIINYNAVDCYANDGFATISTNPCCYSKKHDVWIMTQDGIKEIKQVKNTDKIWNDENKEWCNTSGYFDAGKAITYKVTFSNHEVMYITKNHKLAKSKFKRNGTRIEYDGYDLVELNQLKIGDRISIHCNEVNNFNFGTNGTLEEGLILGWMSGDGCLAYHDDAAIYPDTLLDFWAHEYDVCEKIHKIFNEKLNYQLEIGTNGTNDVKRIRTRVFTDQFTNKYEYNIWKFKSENSRLDFLDNASSDFIKGFLSSYFSADGTVCCNHQAKSYSLSLASINKNRLNQIKYLLNIFGIKSTVTKLREADKTYFENGGTYKTKDCWRLIITGKMNLERFYHNIGLIADKKMEQLKSIVNTTFIRQCKSLNYTKIIGIEQQEIEEVGCIEVEKYHCFTANGLISGNSELPLCVFDSCRLLVQNLYSYVDKPFTNESSFNFDLFKQHASIAQRLMDDVIDLEIEKIDSILKKINQDPESEIIKQEEKYIWTEIRNKCVQGRRTGLGITGIGDTLAALNIKYGSKESICMTDKIIKTQKLESYRSSMEMAKELGSFPIWSWEKEKNSEFLLQIKKEDQNLYEDIGKYGRRNIANMTIAPTGSVSLLTRTTSGIEPLFKLEPYIRRKKINASDLQTHIDYVDPNGDKWQEFKIYHPKVQEWMKITGESDLNKSPWYQCTANDIDWKQRVMLQSAAQKHIDHAISSTINLPENVTEQIVREIYEMAWKSGVKGITVYRDNCRTGVLVSETKKNEEPDEIFLKDKIIKTHSPKRPKSLKCDIHHIKVKGQEYFVIVGIWKDGIPYEVFAGKNGIINKNIEKGEMVKIKRGCYNLKLCNDEIIENITHYLNEEEEVITRLVSLSLRHGCDINFTVHQLEKVMGQFNGFTKALARVLKKYIKDGAKVHGETCPNCNSSNIQRIEGCMTCMNCGCSKCS